MWTLTPFQGTAQEVETDLQNVIQNQREEQIIPVVKKSISDMVEALGGYISVSANGHFNPASGEPGDVIEIHITSLPQPNAPTPPPVETPPAVETPPVLTSQEAVAQNQPETRPEGSVAPPTGSEAPGNAGGLPGLETAPATPVATGTEASVVTPPESSITEVTGSGEGINNPPAITDPPPVDTTQVDPNNPDVAPTAEQIAAGETVSLPQNPSAAETQENVAQLTVGQVEAHEIAQATPPAESAPVNTPVDTTQVFPDISQPTQLDEQGNPVTPPQ